MENNIKNVMNLIKTLDKKENYGKELFICYKYYDKKSKLTSMINEDFLQLVNTTIKYLDSEPMDFILSVKLDNEDIYSFKDYANDLKITSENIYLFYEFMSNEDFKNLSYKIFWLEDKTKSIFMERCHLITKELNIPFSNAALFAEVLNFEFEDIQLYIDKEKRVKDYTPYKDLKNISGLIYFGVKDKLSPINKYIDEIKDSKEYQNYISKIVG